VARLVSDQTRRIRIAPWEARRLAELKDADAYAGVLVSVGYEPRSRAISAHLPNCPEYALAVEFPHQRTDSYFESLAWFRDNGFRISQAWDRQFISAMSHWLQDVLAAGGNRLAIDVSSMSRPRIAAVAQTLTELPGHGDLTVDLLYAPAEFRPPGDLPPGVLSLAPVSQYFVGLLQTRRVPQPLVGLGYEPFKAAGALESLEVRQPILYIPNGFDDRFKPEVLAANDGLIRSHEQPETVEYFVAEPFELYALLEGQLQGLLSNGEAPVVIPLGPKLFALCACLAAAAHHPHVSVWRASFDLDEPAVPHEADGWVCGLTVQRSPREPMDHLQLSVAELIS
jgi:hypothetical protein